MSLVSLSQPSFSAAQATPRPPGPDVGNVTPTTLYDATPYLDDTPLDAGFFKKNGLSASRARQSAALAAQLYPPGSRLDVRVDFVRTAIAEKATLYAPVVGYRVIKQKIFYAIAPSELKGLLEEQAAKGYVLRVLIERGTYPLRSCTQTVQDELARLLIKGSPDR